MTQVCSVYSQLLQLFPRGQFAQAVKQHQAEFNAKGFTCWEQFVAMLFCQVAHLNSLREVCLGLAGCESPLLSIMKFQFQGGALLPDLTIGHGNIIPPIFL